MFQRFKDLPDQGLYGVIGVLAVVALYVIGFVIKNSKNVDVDFVLFSTGIPLITLMVVMLLLGALLGVFLTLVLARRRAAATTVHTVDAPAREHPAPGRLSAGRSAARNLSNSQPRVEVESSPRHMPAESRATARRRRSSTSSGPPGADPEVAQDAIGEAVDDSVHVQSRTPVPRFLDDRRAARVRDLLDHVEAAEQLVAVVLRGRGQQGGVLVRDVLHVSQPVVDQPVPPALERGEDATAAEVAADDDLLDPEHLDRVLQHRQAVEVGVHDDVGDVAVHEDLAGVGAGDLVRGHAAVGAADPEIARRLLRLEAPEEPRIALHHARRPDAIAL